MRPIHRLRCFPAALVCLSAAIPPLACPAEPPHREPPHRELPRILDVVVDASGTFRGTLVDEGGQPRAAADVVLQRPNQPPRIIRTGSSGEFTLAPVHPGLYQLTTPRSAHLVRVWARRTAPPSARSAALLVEPATVARGQQWNPWQRALILSGVIVTSGVVGGVIGYNVKDDAS